MTYQTTAPTSHTSAGSVGSNSTDSSGNYYWCYAADVLGLGSDRVGIRIRSDSRFQKPGFGGRAENANPPNTFTSRVGIRIRSEKRGRERLQSRWRCIWSGGWLGLQNRCAVSRNRGWIRLPRTSAKMPKKVLRHWWVRPVQNAKKMPKKLVHAYRKGGPKTPICAH